MICNPVLKTRKKKKNNNERKYSNKLKPTMKNLSRTINNAAGFLNAL